MARVQAILGALGRAVRREVGTFSSLGLNNFFLFIALILYAASQSRAEPKSAYPLLLFLLTVMLFPLSSDPLDKVPPSRLGLWPVTPAERLQIRIASILLSPVLWIAAAVLAFKQVRPGIAAAFFTTIFGIQAIASIGRVVLARGPGRDFGRNLLRFVPLFPGRVGGLVRNHIRQMFQVLDFYIALIFSLGAVAYRIFAPHPDPEAFPILAMMVALSLSTYAQALFGLDRVSSALTRYRLLPLSGWEILFAKDAAFLLVLFVLVLPLDALAGMAFGLFALAIGHHASVIHTIRLRRWRFSGGRTFLGVVQCVGGFMLGMAVHRVNPGFVWIGAALYAASLFIYGRRLTGGGSR